jgi:aryl-phospho-beta-D-glucosidase BglC (GH1 family)
MAKKYDLWCCATVLRGANLFVRARVEAFDGENGPAYLPAYQPNVFTSLRAAGANVVTLSVPGPYTITSPYRAHMPTVHLLDRLVQGAEAAGLYIVLAFRTGPGRNENDILNFLPVPVERSLHSPGHPAGPAFTRMWRYTANRYRNRPSIAGYDLLVEPHPRVDGGEDWDLFRVHWRVLCEQTVAAIRSVDSQIPILVEPAAWASPAALPGWQMPTGERLVCSVHQYEPFAYTQNENGAGQAPYDIAQTQAAYQQVAAFRATNPGTPVAVTEFGVKNICQDAAGFLTQQLALIESEGCNHMAWNWADDSANFDLRSPSVLAAITANWAYNTAFPEAP